MRVENPEEVAQREHDLDAARQLSRARDSQNHMPLNGMLICSNAQRDLHNGLKMTNLRRSRHRWKTSFLPSPFARTP